MTQQFLSNNIGKIPRIGYQRSFKRSTTNLDASSKQVEHAQASLPQGDKIA